LELGPLRRNKTKKRGQCERLFLRKWEVVVKFTNDKQGPKGEVWGKNGI
jgi:hypothetical protein